jgi:hypothetical protein
MDGKLQRRLEAALKEVDEHGTEGPRLVEDARRLWNRVRRLIEMRVIPTEADVEALELACYALQLPQKQTRAAVGKLGRSNLKQRAEASAELLVTILADDADEALLDRAIRVLHEMPQRQPMLEEARLLADAVNLDDFGVSGMSHLLALLAVQGGGAAQLLEAYEKRDQYGYWDARLKEGFHFDAVRTIARRRLDRAREMLAQLASELTEDRPGA